VHVNEIVQRLRVKLTNDAKCEVTDLPVATDLSRQSTLKAYPLAVNVVRAFELRAIPLNAGL
jgi:hypothetical protein